MQKRNALYKAAVDTRILGTAFGGAIGAIPGLLDLFNKNKKDQKSKSVAKLLLGIGAGATGGNIVSSIYNKPKSTSKKSLQEIYFENVNRGKPLMAVAVGSGLGAIPGIMDLHNVKNLTTEEEKSKAKTSAYKRLLVGAGIGSSIMSFNSIFNRTLNLI